ncbi:VC0807 family protein [Streptosporangium sp. OZ121]|uniref:VC0807 family protein n=1 Tax=Streptosporangium sp. OZ121 TaxID=3444183 RepID=UPI003F79E3A5
MRAEREARAEPGTETRTGTDPKTGAGTGTEAEARAGAEPETGTGAGARAETRTRAGRRAAAVLMLVDLVLPIGLYYALRAAGVGYVNALVAGSLVPGTGMVAVLVRERRLDSVGLFMASAMLVSAGLAVVGGSPRFLLLKGALLMVMAGGWFLATARGPRPLALQFSRPLLEGRTGARDVSWDDLWSGSPRFRRVWRVSTVVWGVGALADAAVRVVIALAVPIDLAVGLSGLQYGAFSVLMLVIMNVYQARAGLHDPRSGLYLVPGAGRHR